MEHENIKECTPQVAAVATSLFGPISTELLISEVFLLVTLQDVVGESESPDRADGEYDPASCVRVGLTTVSISLDDQSDLWQDERDAPISIDVAIVLDKLAEDTKEEVSSECDCHRDYEIGSICLTHVRRCLCVEHSEILISHFEQASDEWLLEISESPEYASSTEI